MKLTAGVLVAAAAAAATNAYVVVPPCPAGESCYVAANFSQKCEVRHLCFPSRSFFRVSPGMQRVLLVDFVVSPYGITAIAFVAACRQRAAASSTARCRISTTASLKAPRTACRSCRAQASPATRLATTPPAANRSVDSCPVHWIPPTRRPCARFRAASRKSHLAPQTPRPAPKARTLHSSASKRWAASSTDTSVSRRPSELLWLHLATRNRKSTSVTSPFCAHAMVCIVCRSQQHWPGMRRARQHQLVQAVQWLNHRLHLQCDSVRGCMRYVHCLRFGFAQGLETTGAFTVEPHSGPCCTDHVNGFISGTADQNTICLTASNVQLINPCTADQVCPSVDVAFCAYVQGRTRWFSCSLAPRSVRLTILLLLLLLLYGIKYQQQSQGCSYTISSWTTVRSRYLLFDMMLATGNGGL